MSWCCFETLRVWEFERLAPGRGTKGWAAITYGDPLVVGRWWGWGCDDVFCGCYCAWGVRYLMILCTLMDSGGGKGERAGVGFKGEGIWKGQFGNDPSSPPLYS